MECGGREGREPGVGGGFFVEIHVAGCDHQSRLRHAVLGIEGGVFLRAMQGAEGCVSTGDGCERGWVFGHGENE